MEHIESKAKVSVIVPVYNVEKYLSRCIDSLLRQTLTNIEIILVDDESPDKCPQMCDAFATKDNRIKVIHKKNGGLGYARNSGLDISTGEYVSFLDSDDYVDSATYQWLYETASKSNSDAVYYSYETFDDTGKAYGHNLDDSIIEYKCQDSIKRLMLDMVGSSPNERNDRNIQMSSCTAFYRRSVIENYNLRFLSEREYISEDLIFNMDFLAHASKVLRTNRSFYHYYINTNSLTHKIRLDRIERNVHFYNFVLEKLKAYPDYQHQDSYRAMRMLIGYCRGSIMQVLKSNIPILEKHNWLIKVCNMAIWENIFSEYPVSHLPLRYRIFFWTQCKKKYGLIKLMSIL